MTQSLPVGLTDTFVWSDQKGYGFHTRPAMLYTGDYFEHYQKLDNTKMGMLLTRARLDLVSKYTDTSRVVDIGIGGGRFVQESGGSGYDVCDSAAKWLKDAGKWVDPYAPGYGNSKFYIHAATCWDSLEHIPSPEKLLEHVNDWLFVSLPVCDTQAEWLQSRHFKPAEHIHYWSAQGLIAWCAEQGFECVEMNRVESDLGREGIMSFAFKRVAG